MPPTGRRAGTAFTTRSRRRSTIDTDRAPALVTYARVPDGATATAEGPRPTFNVFNTLKPTRSTTANRFAPQVRYAWVPVGEIAIRLGFGTARIWAITVRAARSTTMTLPSSVPALTYAREPSDASATSRPASGSGTAHATLRATRSIALKELVVTT